jgi:hypothetical protein
MSAKHAVVVAAAGYVAAAAVTLLLLLPLLLLLLLLLPPAFRVQQAKPPLGSVHVHYSGSLYSAMPD